MNTIERYIYVFVIATLTVLLFLKSCKKVTDGSAGVVTILKETRIDTIPGQSIDRPVPIPYPAFDTVMVHDTIVRIDTITVEKVRERLIAANIPKMYYPDTLRLGTKGFVALKDTVQGLITSRAFDWKVFETITTITKNTVEKKRNKLYLGFEYKYPLNYMGAGLMLQFKSDNILKADYGFINKEPQYGIGCYLKIRFRK